MNPAKSILESISVAEFPLLAQLLNTDAGPLLKKELNRLLSQRWVSRSPRLQAEVVARLRGDAFDEAVLLRNISASGVLLQVKPQAEITLDQGPLTLTMHTSRGVVDVPILFARLADMSPGKFEVAFRFTELDLRGGVSNDDIRNLLYVGSKQVQGSNSEPK